MSHTPPIAGHSAAKASLSPDAKAILEILASPKQRRRIIISSDDENFVQQMRAAKEEVEKSPSIKKAVNDLLDGEFFFGFSWQKFNVEKMKNK